MDIQVTTANIDDTAIIARFNQLMALETEDKELNPDIIHQGVESLIKNPSRGFYTLARYENRIVGQLMITYEWSDWRNANIWWIQSVYVQPEFRRQGIFTRLYQHVKELAKKQHACGLRLYAELNNTTAHNTYQSLGMQQTNYYVFESMFQD